MYERKKDIFDQPTLEGAREVILTTYAGFESAHRWEVETPSEVEVLKHMIPPGASVCDFGIGIGRVASALLEERVDIRVTGIDSSGRMLGYCREYVPAQLQERLALVPYQTMRGLADDSFDFIFSIYVLQHIPAEEFEPAILELKRMLKPDGSLYVLNTDTFRAVPMGKPTWFNDRFPQWEVIGKHFEKIRDVSYESAYMRRILETHKSQLLRPLK